MTKLRVYEYAKQLNMSSKEIITILNRLDVPVANHMSVMDDQMVTKVEQFFSDVKRRAAQKHATEVERALREKQRQRERQARQVEQQNRANARPTNEGSDNTDRRVDNFATQAPSRNNLSGRNTSYSGNTQAPAATSQTATSTPMRKEEAAPAPVNQDREDKIQTTRETVDAVKQPSSAVHSTDGPTSNRPTRPANAAPTSHNQHRPQSSERSGDFRSRSPQQGTGRPQEQGNRPYGQGRPGEYRNRPQGQGSRPDGQRSGQGGRPGGYDDRNRSGYPRSGGQSGGGQRPAGGNSGGGYGNKDGRTGGYQGGGGNRPNTGGGRPGGGGGRPGAGNGSRSGAPVMAVASKPVSPGSQRKEKEKDRTKTDFSRDRKERFNEDKLVNRSGASRRRGVQGGERMEQRKPESPAKISVEGVLSVGDFAKLIRKEPSEIIKKLLFLGIMATINQEIDTDAMELIAGEYGIAVEVIEPVDEEALDMLMEEDKAEELTSRPPVVTIMGHVDHGKTTLLDAIRNSRVTATESGGITQHIGAYQVEVNQRKITFLDTPGHEAFTTMRARGAQVTDITILVVAADDGVMPQTVEAINHAKAANVPIIVAVNKIDKAGANPDRVKQELSQHGLVSEDWGGETIFAHISALKQEGLDSLLEMVLLVADMQELKANATGRPRGSVIEAKLDKGRGPVATVLVQNGTLRVGDIVVAGTSYGRIRAMTNDHGKRIKEAPPSTPVEIQGLGEVPSAGDLFVVYDDERKARNLAQKRTNRERAEQMSGTSRVTLDDLYRQIKEGTVKELNVIVKADVQGSVEALVQAIDKIDVEGVRVKVIHRGAGAITESDVGLASASNGIVIGFHVRPDVNAKRAAEAEGVDIRLYRVIYNVIEELESALKGMLDPEYKEVVLGHAEVRQVISISRVGKIAGCYVVDGKLTRDAEARVVREGVVVYEGSLESLKRFKDDVREVATGYECGVTLERFQDLKEGDIVEAFKMEAIKAH